MPATYLDLGPLPVPGLLGFRATTTDENGEVRKVYQSVRDEVVAVEERNEIGGAPKTLVTGYRYDPVSQLRAVVDAKGNVTRAEYDSLGQMVALTSPDAGRTEYRYDLSGNLAARQTANLRARGQLIRYVYRFNRLERIDYPDSADVTYVYGAPGAPAGQAGRIARVTDESGTEDRFYGSLGEVVRTVRTPVAPCPTFLPCLPLPPAYTTTFEYDSFARLLTQTQPDGEKLTYSYDAGGSLARVEGFTQSTLGGEGVAVPYVTRIGYDELGQRVRLALGNGVVTRYRYEPLLRRLAAVDTKAPGPGGAVIQALRYGYDPVGNVTSLRDDSSSGGRVQTFRYDDLHQLVGATGEPSLSIGGAPPRHAYTLSLSYDEIGNITRKSQQARVDDALVSDKSYTFTYGYGARPHAPVSLTPPDPQSLQGRTLTYDADGNTTGWQQGSAGVGGLVGGLVGGGIGGLLGAGPRRQIAWNEEDRVRSITDTPTSGGAVSFLYDAGGNRSHKRSGGGETVYVSPTYVVTSGGAVTKHVFAGETRVASIAGAGSSNPGLFFYHPDHLQSTQYVTDGAGAVVQQHQYFPTGETWFETAGRRLDWLFTAKELDEETGLYYFGARYYDPRIGLWASPDPILASYMQGAPNGGVGFPRNLGLYTYGWNNPVVLRDPDGLAVGDNFLTRALKTVAGIGYGTVQALTPGGFLTPSPSNDSDFLTGQAAGQFATGTVEVVAGGTAVGAAGVAEVGSVGLATPVAVPVAAAGVAVVANGAESVIASGQTLAMANKAAEAERAAGGGGRGGNQFRGPDPKAEGPHTRFRTDDKGVTTYETYDYPTPGVGKRVDAVGPPHGGVPTPHTVDTVRHVNPRDPTKSSIRESRPRPSTPDEIPRRRE